MEFDLAKLKAAGKFESDFEERYPVPEEICDLPGVRFSGEAIVKGHLSVLDRSCFVDCEISYVLAGECSRCLTETEQTFPCSLREEFTGYRSEEHYAYCNHRLVLDKAINDAISMSLPIRLLCREDCKGLCPVCGRPKAAGCSCCTAEAETPAANQGLAILKQLLSEDSH